MTPRRLVSTIAIGMIAAAAIVVAGTRWVAVPWDVEGSSMLPTLRPGDRVIVDLWSYRHRLPREGEIALLISPNGGTLVKRVAGPPKKSETFAEVGFVVLGDNPPASVDSRTFGPVSSTRFRGRVVFRYWPLDRIGPIE